MIAFLVCLYLSLSWISVDLAFRISIIGSIKARGANIVQISWVWVAASQILCIVLHLSS